MTLQPFEQVLVDGGRHELLQFGSCQHCVVVDWRDDVKAVLGGVQRMLPEGCLEYRRVDDQTWEIQCHGVQHSIVAPDDMRTERLLRAINRVLLPEYEMRIFTPTKGDGYSLLVRPTTWWSEFSTAHEGRARKLFITTDHQAEITGADSPVKSKPKSWLSRLFKT
jgi:hypothetical protein